MLLHKPTCEKMVFACRCRDAAPPSSCAARRPPGLVVAWSMRPMTVDEYDGASSGGVGSCFMHKLAVWQPRLAAAGVTTVVVIPRRSCMSRTPLQCNQRAVRRSRMLLAVRTASRFACRSALPFDRLLPPCIFSLACISHLTISRMSILFLFSRPVVKS